MGRAKKKISQSKIDHVATIYHTAKDFDAINTALAFDIIRPYCVGKSVLEVGCGMGEMTVELVKVARSLSVVEPAERYYKAVLKKLGDKITISKAFIEDFKCDRKFQIIVLASALHHLPDPIATLRGLKKLLVPNGTIVATTPNALSLHRQVGVRAGLLKNELDNSERNRRFHHQHKFTRDSLTTLFRKAGYRVSESYGYMLKPFSSEQMQQLNLPWKVIKALNELGKQNQDLSSQLFVKAKSC